MESDQQRRLLLFTPGSLDSMLSKGNAEYVRHYERFFDEVVVAYLTGPPGRVEMGKTRLVSLGRGRSTGFDLFLAPFRLLSLARSIGPTCYLTADLVFSWWTSLLVRIVLRAKVVLMPVCIPEEIYAGSGTSLTGRSVRLERWLTRLCFRAPYRVITAASWTGFISWLQTNPAVREKLRVLPTMVEELPPPDFYQVLRDAGRGTDDGLGRLSSPRLVYVGRLHAEKLVLDLVAMLGHARHLGLDPTLVIVGEGPERGPMEDLANRLGMADRLVFRGSLGPAGVARELLAADVFVSTVTGTAFREAGLAGLPVVGYMPDWGKGLIEHDENALLASVGDAEALARQLTRLSEEPDVRHRVAASLRALAWERWDPDRLARSLAVGFEDLLAAAPGRQNVGEAH